MTRTDEILGAIDRIYMDARDKGRENSPDFLKMTRYQLRRAIRPHLSGAITADELGKILDQAITNGHYALGKPEGSHQYWIQLWDEPIPGQLPGIREAYGFTEAFNATFNKKISPVTGAKYLAFAKQFISSNRLGY